MKKLKCTIALCFLICIVEAQSLKGKSILLFTKNGKGYVHDNIAAANHCFDSLSSRFAFKLIKSQDAAVFTTDQLNKTDLIVFASTNNDVFDSESQKLAFRNYVESGGKVLAIHSAIGTERNWTWFKQMLGGTFAWHPHFQPFDLVKIKPQHPSLNHIPARWTHEDECYFNKELYPGTECLLAVDLKTLHPDSTEMAKYIQYKGNYSDIYPISWIHRFDGGLIYLTTLGHHIKEYQGGIFVDYLVDAMKFLTGDSVKFDAHKAYAKDINEPVKNLMR